MSPLEHLEHHIEEYGLSNYTPDGLVELAQFAAYSATLREHILSELRTRVDNRDLSLTRAFSILGHLGELK